MLSIKYDVHALAARPRAYAHPSLWPPPALPTPPSDEVGQALPTAAAANAQYIAARAAGLGDADFAAVMEAVAAAHQQQHKQ